MLDRVTRVLTECNNRRDDVKITEGHVRTLENVVQGYIDDIEEKEKEIVLSEKTSKLLQSISDTRNKVAKEKIEGVLNYALSNIPLEQNYRAILEETSSRRSGRELAITLEDIETGYRRSLRNQTGTWVKQLVSFILTMIIVKFSGSSRVLVLDEVFSGMEDHKMIKVFGEILVSLAENEDFQIIMVEHGKELDELEGIKNIPLRIIDYDRGTEIVT